MTLKKIGKVLTNKFVWTGRGPRLIKRLYQAAISRRLRNTALGYFDMHLPFGSVIVSLVRGNLIILLVITTFVHNYGFSMDPALSWAERGLCRHRKHSRVLSTITQRVRQKGFVTSRSFPGSSHTSVNVPNYHYCLHNCNHFCHQTCM
jgi:hypothetical protein